MNIIHVLPNLALGGLQTFTVDLANEQVLKGCNVKIITLMDSNENPLIERCNPKIKIVNLKGSTKFYNILLMFKLLFSIKSNAIVHTHGISLYFTFLASLFCRKAKFFHTVHNLAQNEAGKIRREFARISFNLGLSFPITISNEVSHSFKNYYQGTQYQQINNGLSSHDNSKLLNDNSAKIELEKLKINSETKIYLSVGRIDYQKNRAMLLDAFYKFAHKKNAVLAIIGGPIDLKDEYYAPLSVHKAVKEKKVHFLGMKSNVHDYLEESDYFCLTSIFEGLPISVLEAIRSGKICICTPAGGIKSLLHDVGYVSKDFSTYEYFVSLTEAEKNTKSLSPSQIKKYFKANWDMQTCAKKYLALYQAKL